MPDSEPATGDPERADLAAMVVPLGRALVAVEVPLLDARGLSMWAYVVLSALEGEPVRSQAALAQAIGADKTRIIGVLDDLQDRGLISRRPDPGDRRVRLLSISDAGRSLRRAVSDDIQRAEERLLARLTPGDRAAFLRALATLSPWPPGDPSPG